MWCITHGGREGVEWAGIARVLYISSLQKSGCHISRLAPESYCTEQKEREGERGHGTVRLVNDVFSLGRKVLDVLICRCCYAHQGHFNFSSPSPIASSQHILHFFYFAPIHHRYLAVPVPCIYSTDAGDQHWEVGSIKHRIQIIFVLLGPGDCAVNPSILVLFLSLILPDCILEGSQ